MRRIAWVLLAAFVVLLGSIVLFRFVNPPITAVMLVERLKGVSLHQDWVPLTKISPNLRLAVISSEDGQFCRHRGVDWGAVREAVEEAVDLEKARGASTIPMQTAKNLYLWRNRSLVRKMFEVPLAYMMSAIWSKRRMLEIYLNIAQLGPGIFGAEAASRHYFGKSAANLSRREAALLAATLPNPRARNPARPSRTMLLIAKKIERRMPVMAKRASCVLKRP